MIAIGSDGMMAAVSQARQGMLAPHLKPGHKAIASITSGPADAIGMGDKFGSLKAGRAGDLVIWDNWSSIHARADFPREEPRLMRRLTIEGQAMRF